MLVTDVLQFVIKMGMVIVLAVAAVHAVGGMGAMKAKLLAIDAARVGGRRRAGSILSFVPDVGSAWMPVITFSFIFRCTGGPPGIRAPNPAAADMSRSGCSALRTNVTRCSRRCGSTSRIMPCVPGPGFWSASRLILVPEPAG